MTVRSIEGLRDLITVTRTPSPGKVYASHIRDIIDTLGYLTKKTVLRKTASYAATLEDDGAKVYYNSIIDVVHIVPLDAPVGYQGVIVQEGSGAVSLSPTPSLSRESHVKTSGVGAHMYFSVYQNTGSAPLISISGDTVAEGDGVTGTKWYVDNAVATSGNGTSWATAWKNFTNINWTSIQPGDGLYISGGSTSKSYFEVLNIGKAGTAGLPITISGGLDSGHNGTVIIDGQNTRNIGLYNDGRNFVTARRLKVQNHGDCQVHWRWLTEGAILENVSTMSGDIPGGNSRGFDFRNNLGVGATVPLIMRNCLVETPASTTAQTDGIWSSNNNNIVIENNRIIISNSDTTGHSDGLQSFNDFTITFRNNYVEQANAATTDNHGTWMSNTKTGGVLKIHGNVFYVPNLTSDSAVSHWAESAWTETGYAEFIHNTIIGGSRGLNLDKSPNTVVRDNIIIPAATGIGVYMANGNLTPSNVTNNLVYAASGNAAFVSNAMRTWVAYQGLGYDVGGINGIPTFTNVSARNFTLSSGSPGIGGAGDGTNMGAPYPV